MVDTTTNEIKAVFNEEVSRTSTAARSNIDEINYTYFEYHGKYSEEELGGNGLPYGFSEVIAV